MKSFIRALGNILLTVLVIILIVYGWAFIEMKLLLKSQPELFGYAFYMQGDDAMSPEFSTNDVIVIKKDAEYVKGDYVLYLDGEKSVYKVQNVVSITTDQVTTRCLNCSEGDTTVSTDNVVGKAVGKVVFMGKIINFFKQKVVLITIAVVGVAFLVISQYMEFKPKKVKEEN